MTTMPDPANTRMARAQVSLDGLSVGDAFGERGLPEPPWCYTDDTQMALSIVETLREQGEIEQTFLAKSFGKRYDISRGYGPAMHQLLPMIRSGKRWEREARSLFGGQGSWGNGSAMRVAPLGAYFADDLDDVVEQAAKSAAVTHAHPEAVAGAIAIAVAAPSPATRASEERLSNWANSLSRFWRASPKAKRRQESYRRVICPPMRQFLLWRRRWAMAGVARVPIPCPSACGAPRSISTTTKKPCGPRSARWVTVTRPAQSSVGSSPATPESGASRPTGWPRASRCPTGFLHDRQYPLDGRAGPSNLDLALPLHDLGVVSSHSTFAW